MSQPIGFIEGISAKRDRWDPPGFLGFKKLSVKRSKTPKILWKWNCELEMPKNNLDGRILPSFITHKKAASRKPNFTFYTSRTQDFVLLSFPLLNMTTLCGFQTCLRMERMIFTNWIKSLVFLGPRIVSRRCCSGGTGIGLWSSTWH